MRQDQAGSSGENDLPKHLSSTYLLWLPGKIGLWFFAAVVSALTAAQLWESRPHSYLDKHDTISFPSDKSRIAQGGGKECDITDHSTLLASKRDIFIIHLAEMQDHSKKSFYEITLRCFHIWSWKSVKRLVSDSQLCYVNHLTSQPAKLSWVLIWSHYRGSSPYAHFGTWKKPCYMKLVLVGLY